MTLLRDRADALVGKLTRLTYRAARRCGLPPVLPALLEAESRNVKRADGAETSKLLYDAIRSGSPFLASRFGGTEIRLLLSNRLSHGLRSRVTVFMNRHLHGGHLDLTPDRLHNAWVCSGIFPPKLPSAKRFCAIYENAGQQIDLLGSWLGGETYFVRTDHPPIATELPNLEPYFHDLPWSAALEGRRVLVVHPFTESIERQYRDRRSQLFENPRVLPAFELQTYRPIQSLGLKPEGFEDWASALQSMRNDLADLRFDVALIGCGAYGLPLGAFIKRHHKVPVVHIGGALQILFGIQGRRWDSMPNISKLYNSAWVRPLSTETPPTREIFERTEGTGYW